MSERAEVLLLIVDANTDKDWTTGELRRFFVPSSRCYYLDYNGKRIDTFISGAGDASALKGLECKGLIERPRTDLPNKHCYAITEAGRVAAEQIRNR